MDAENNPSTAHLFIINPLHARAVDGLFSTHPNAQNRIQAFREMVLNEKNFFRCYISHKFSIQFFINSSFKKITNAPC